MTLRALSPEAREGLITRYMAGGCRAISADCRRLNINVNSIIKAASKRGYRRRGRRNVSIYTEGDKRWERAKAVGAISL